LKERSVLDDVFKSLADRTKECNHNSDKFWLTLPEGGILIKKKFSIRDLIKFKENIAKDVVTSDGMKELALIDENSEKAFTWLNSWCDFDDWNHIIRAFNVLEFKTSGREPDIKARTLKKLGEIFIDSKVEVVYNLILSYIDSNSTYSGAMMPRHLLGELKDYMRSDVPRWSMYRTDGKGWFISGIQDLEKNNEIEKPVMVVNKLWNNLSESVNSIKICGNYRDDCCISNSLMRLSAHSLGAYNSYCSNKTRWEDSLKNKTGNTLGTGRNDFDDQRLLSLPDDTYYYNESKKLRLIKDIEEYALQLNDEMYMVTLNRIGFEIIEKISNMNEGSLRTEVELRWIKWENELKDDTKKQRELFSKILRPNIEGESVSAEIRCGLKTTTLLSEAIFMLLILSVCLDKDGEWGFNAVADDLHIKAIGLNFWSGPSDIQKKVVKIDNYKYINKLLENESEEIIILSGSDRASSDIYDESLAGEDAEIGLLIERKRPKLLITNDMHFEKLVEKGDVSALTNYLEDKINNYNKCIVNSIRKVSGDMYEV